MRVASLVALATLAAPTASFADDDVIPGHVIDRPVTGAIVGITAVGAFGFSLIPIREQAELWQSELLGSDVGVHDNFSRRASHISDGLLAASLVAPVAYLTGSTIEDADGDRLLVYGQSMAINAAFAQAAKYLVQRPRPYLYSKDPAVQSYARMQGADARRSFYSGHASLSFGAAVTGAYLLGASTDSRSARALAWGAGLFTASAAANMRVRAGKHFYSDVLIGSAVGITVGYIVPALNADGAPYVPSGEEIAIAGAGIFAGLLVSQLLPLEKKRSEVTLDPKASVLSRVQLTPVPMPNGFGFGLTGAL